MSYQNTNYEYGSYIRPTLSAGVYTYSYSSLTLNPSTSDQDQIIVLRKFTPTSAFTAASAPGGLGGVKIKGEEQWAAWTLPNSTTSGSSMYSIDEVSKTITLSSSANDYIWNRNGTSINLPVFDPATDELVILRRTAAVNPFVTWQGSSKLTAEQLNLQTKQLLYSVQETIDDLRRINVLSPYYGNAEGLCPLDSTGVVPEANLGANSVLSALAGRNINPGTGLSGGGNLGTDVTLNIDTTTLPYLAGSGIRYIEGEGIEVDLLNASANDSGLNFVGDQLYVYTVNDLVTNVSSRPLSAAQGVALKGLVDALGTGVRYLGSVEAAVQGTLKITFSGLPTNNETITLISAETGGTTSKTYTAKSAGAVASNQEFNIGGDAATTATNLSGLITSVNGHNGKLKVSDNGSGTLTITQNVGGTAGNTAVTNSLSNVTAVGNISNTANQFDGGLAQGAFPGVPSGTEYAAGDTVDVITGGTIISPVLGASDSDQLDNVATGVDIRYNGSEWYNAGTTATIDTSLFVQIDGTSTMGGSLDMGAYKITNLAAPTAGTDASTKTYADGVVATKILSTLSDVTGTASAGDIIKRNAANTEWVLVPTSDTDDGISIGSLNDVELTSAQNNDLLLYDTASGKWSNSSAYSTPQTWFSGGTGESAITGGLSGGYGDGSDTTFDLGSSVAPTSTVPSAFIITFDGVIQQASSYTISGSTVTFATAPPYGVEIYLVCIGLSREVSGPVAATTLTASQPATLSSTLSVGSTLGVTGHTSLTTMTASGLATVAGLIDTTASSLQGMSIVDIKWFKSLYPTHFGITGTYYYWRLIGARGYLTPKKAGNKVILWGNCWANGSRKSAFAKNFDKDVAPDGPTGAALFQWNSNDSNANVGGGDYYNRKLVRSAENDNESYTTRRARHLSQSSCGWSSYTNASDMTNFPYVVDTITEDDMAQGEIWYDAVIGEYAATVNVYPHYGNQFILIEVSDPNNTLSMDNFGYS